MPLTVANSVLDQNTLWWVQPIPSSLAINMGLGRCISSLSSSFFLLLLLSTSVVMESSIPAIFPAGTLPENPFSSLENGFTPWESCELFPSHPQSPKPVSDEPNRSDQNPANSNSCSDELNRTASDIDERKRRRMISNRESARRSRMRKQTHLENLRNQASQLRIENRDLTNRLRYLLYQTHSVRSENDQLRSEQGMLQQRLSNAGQILIFRQPQQQYTSAWLCNNAITNETPLSLVTS